MKKIITICAALLMTASVFAQAPEKMSYQAVIRNSSDALVTNTNIGMQISILQGSASGTAVYVETQTPTSNANGLVSLEIGAGTVVSGNFSTIDWANGPYYIQTETDPVGGTNYTITVTSQLLSVPYALHAKTAESFTGTISETDPIFGVSIASGISSIDTANWNNDLVNDGDTTYWKVNNNNLYYNQGFVGIGTDSPNGNLDIFSSNSKAELFIHGNGTGPTHSGVVLNVSGGNIGNKRGSGLFMVDSLGGNEWFLGRPYGINIGLTSDRFVIQRNPNNATHSTSTAALTDGGGNPTGTERFFTVENNGNVGIGVGSATVNSRLEVANGDVSISSIGSGIILKSPNGNCWRVTVDNSGNFVSTAITCP